MKSRALLQRLSAGHYKNVRFRDMQRLLEELGFTLARVSGSHHIYTCTGIEEIVNIQNVGGEAKPYQIRQIVKLIEQYDLAGE
jgi:predicted RNA binding protein YcfA (HicA-like mRNA interferase family)